MDHRLNTVRKNCSTCARYVGFRGLDDDSTAKVNFSESVKFAVGRHTQTYPWKLNADFAGFIGSKQSFYK